MYTTLLTAALALVASVSALTPANTANPPSGNPIGHPGLGELIPAGNPYTITWTPTDPSTKISLVLLRGPSENVVPILTIADSIDNTGSYTWTPPTTLEPDTTHYGIELIVEGTGEYQYSPQCGVSNPSFSGSSSNSTSAAPTSGATTTMTASAYSKATGTGNFSVPVVSPTKSMSVPSSLETLTSTFSQTGGATTGGSSPTTPVTQPSSSSPSSNNAVATKLSFGGLVLVGLVGTLLL